MFFANHDDLKPCKGRIPKWLERARHPDRINDPQRDHTKGPFCTCRKKDDGSFMLACDWCDEWYHGACVGITRTQIQGPYKYDACAEDRDEFKMTAIELKQRNRVQRSTAQSLDQETSDSSSDAESN